MNLIIFNTNYALNILFDSLKIQQTNNIVSDNYNIFTVNAYEVSHSTRFDVFKNSVDIHDMSAQILDETNDTVIVHRDDYLFA